jgi:hypothetical protein
MLARHGLQIDGHQGGAGKFRDLYVGIGADYAKLTAFRTEFVATGTPMACMFTSVNVPTHPQYGKPMLEIKSYWWDRPN